MSQFCNFHHKLECPVCFDYYMNKRIIMCNNGHNVCSPCYNQLVRQPTFVKCPLCRTVMSKIRNNNLEEAARSAQYPCTCLNYDSPLIIRPFLRKETGFNKCPMAYFGDVKCTGNCACNIARLWEHLCTNHSFHILTNIDDCILYIYNKEDLRVFFHQDNIFYVFKKYLKCYVYWLILFHPLRTPNEEYQCKLTIHGNRANNRYIINCKPFNAFDVKLLNNSNLKIRYDQILKYGPSFKYSIAIL